MEVGSLALKDRIPEAKETIHIPLLNGLLVGIEIDGEVEKIGHKEPGRTATGIGRLQYIESFQDHDVGLANRLRGVRDNVVMQMGIDGGGDFGQAGLDIGQKM